VRLATTKTRCKVRAVNAGGTSPWVSARVV
jgi:hypothetical protein